MSESCLVMLESCLGCDCYSLLMFGHEAVNFCCTLSCPVYLMLKKISVATKITDQNSVGFAGEAKLQCRV